MRRTFAALIAAVALVAVSVAPAAAITKHYVKDFDHTYVGLIAFYDADWTFVHRCTGELLAPTVVLTAGHCTDNEHGTVNAHARIWFQQGAGTHYDPATQLDTVTGYPDYCAAGTLGTLCAEADVMYNYGFNNFAGFPNIHDVGIVILNQSITGLGSAQLAAPGTIDEVRKGRSAEGAVFRVSGYGLSYSLPIGALSFRERLQANETLVNTVSRNTAGYNIQLNPNGGDFGGTCSGDSGGPVFYPATSDQIVAVTSFGMNAYCRGDDFFYRTDRQAVIDWILAHAGADADQIVVND